MCRYVNRLWFENISDNMHEVMWSSLIWWAAGQASQTQSHMIPSLIHSSTHVSEGMKA